MNKTIYDIKVWKLLIIFFSALILEANGIASFRYLVDKNWLGMILMVFINPFLCLPLNHYTIEVKTIKQRAIIAFAFASGFAVGVITIRPFFI
jgi:ABC-type Mn2+/Zn2+ transport system permease subunit